MFKQFFRLLKSSAVVAALLVSGCGGGSPAARDGSIIINPTGYAWTSIYATHTPPSPCAGSPITYSKLVITVLNANGSPVPDTGISVTLDLSNATGGGVMALYDDPAWDSGSSTPPTNLVGASYSTKTGSSGTKSLVVAMDQSCEYTGYLSAWAGSLYGQAELSVTASN